MLLQYLHFKLLGNTVAMTALDGASTSTFLPLVVCTGRQEPWAPLMSALPAWQCINRHGWDQRIPTVRRSAEIVLVYSHKICRDCACGNQDNVPTSPPSQPHCPAHPLRSHASVCSDIFSPDKPTGSLHQAGQSEQTRMWGRGALKTRSSNEFFIPKAIGAVA